MVTKTDFVINFVLYTQLYYVLKMKLENIDENKVDSYFLNAILDMIKTGT